MSSLNGSQLMHIGLVIVILNAAYRLKKKVPSGKILFSQHSVTVMTWIHVLFSLKGQIFLMFGFLALIREICAAKKL